jgi:hypothetical protein
MEEFACVELGCLRSEKRFEAPAQIRALPGFQAVAPRRDPVIVQGLEHFESRGISRRTLPIPRVPRAYFSSFTVLCFFGEMHGDGSPGKRRVPLNLLSLPFFCKPNRESAREFGGESRERKGSWLLGRCAQAPHPDARGRRLTEVHRAAPGTQRHCLVILAVFHFDACHRTQRKTLQKF